MGFSTTLKTRLHAATHPPLKSEAQWVVTITDQNVSCTRPNGKVESLAWDDLQVVAIETSDEGPYVMDVFWYLAGEHSGCVIPNGATGVAELIERLQALADFDNASLSNAMASASNARFILWRRAAEG
jgi:hypothetical protein